MRRKEADDAAKGMFGDAGVAWEEYEGAAPADGRVFKVGLIDEMRIYRPFGESAESYDDAFECALKCARGRS